MKPLPPVSCLYYALSRAIFYEGNNNNNFMYHKPRLYMHRLSLLLVALLLTTACGNKNEEPQMQDDAGAQMEQSDAPQQDISNEALTEIDPQIQMYIGKVNEARQAYDENPDAKTKEALENAYIAFGDYMTYESPVSPRKGKYRRALVEYRHALALDPDNEKVKREIQQIEEIYRSMGRPIPQGDA